MSNLESHFLYPAALYVTRDNYQIHTILGSCVAVCLWDTQQKFGGMCHYMLPLWNGEGLASPKYGNIAVDRMVDKMLGLGSRKRDLIAKVFGGGEVIETKSQQFLIGKRNIELAWTKLEEHKIRVVSSSVGGKLGRKIIFFTATGEVKHRYVQRSSDVMKNVK